MADTVTTAILANGPRNLIVRCTNISLLGDGEASVAKLDATDTALGVGGVANGIYWKVRRIQYDIRNGGLRVMWDADVDVDMMVLDESGDQKFDRGGIKVPAVAGSTGIIRFSTVGWMINSGYDVTLHMIKGVPQS